MTRRSSDKSQDVAGPHNAALPAIGNCPPIASSPSRSPRVRRASRSRIRRPGAACSTIRGWPRPRCWADRIAALVSTVPPQHMYGLEASLLSALTAPAAPCTTASPFFPADVRARIRVDAGTARAGDHARAPEGAGGRGHRTTVLDRVVSATAPLRPDSRAASKTLWQVRSRGDLRLHRGRRDGASTHHAERMLAHLQRRDDDGAGERGRIPRTTIVGARCRCTT